MREIYSGMTFRERLMSRVWPVTESGCWLHDGATVGDGYAAVAGGRAHRVFYAEFVGPIPAGKVIAHTCDVPCCVNPRHLVAQTQAENIADKVKRGRQAKGEQQASSKLTDKLAIEIRSATAQYKPGMYTSLAQKYGVDRAVIARIAKGRSWRHVA